MFRFWFGAGGLLLSFGFFSWLVAFFWLVGLSFLGGEEGVFLFGCGLFGFFVAFCLFV